MYEYAHPHLYLGLYALRQLGCSRWSCRSLQNSSNRYDCRRSPKCSWRRPLRSTLGIQGPNGRNVPGEEIISQPCTLTDFCLECQPWSLSAILHRECFPLLRLFGLGAAAGSRLEAQGTGPYSYRRGQEGSHRGPCTPAPETELRKHW